MKRTALVVFAACALVALMAGVAFAQGFGYNTSAYPGYLVGGDSGVNPDYTANTVYKEALASPHGNFDLSSEQCAVCHSVHHAATGFALLPGYNTNVNAANTADGGCVFCHVDTTIGYIQVYDGTWQNFANASDFGHDMTGGASCSNCHQVHAATSSMPAASTGGYLVQKILQDGTMDMAIPAASSNEVQVSIWCTSCHPKYYAPDSSAKYGYNGQSHIMTAVADSYLAAAGHGPDGKIAQYNSTTCHDCHARGEVNKAADALADPAGFPQPDSEVATSGGSFPHYTDGARFLQAATATDAAGVPTAIGGASSSHADAVCFSCHRGADVIDSGVGIGW